MKQEKNLIWGSSEFYLLGIHFSVSLDKLNRLNFDPITIKIRELLDKWKKRLLTPLGRITVLKTLILPKFNHLFMSLPSPSEKTIKEINSLFFKFIWDNKPDKIGRSILVKHYSRGGLNMVDLEKFIIALKANWIKRLWYDEGSQWTKLIDSQLICKRRLLLLGPSWCQLMQHKISNPFWCDLLKSWNTIKEAGLIKDLSDFLKTSLWYNPKIGTEKIFYPSWFRRSITSPADIVDNNGTIFPKQEIENSYKLTINFLDYHRIKILVTQNVNKLRYQHFERPFIPTQLESLIKLSKGSKNLYLCQFNNDNMQEDFQMNKRKWDMVIPNSINIKGWEKAYKICFECLDDNIIKWFQYRVLNLILGTRSYLYRVKIGVSPLCGYCNSGEETIIHLMCDCTEVKALWIDLKSFVSRQIQVDLDIDPRLILFGYHKQDTNHLVLNIIYLVTKKYIFDCSRKKNKPQLSILLRKFQRVYIEQECLSYINSKETIFQKRWSKVKTLVQSI